MSSVLKVRSENSEVGPDPHRAQANVEIRESNGEEAEPREQLVAAIESGHARVARDARTRRRDLVASAAHQVPQRMAAERVARKEQRVDRQQQAADADPEMGRSCGCILEPERVIRVRQEDDDEENAEIEEVAVHVLQHEWERTLAEIRFSGLADRAR